MLLGLCVVVVALLGWGLAASATGAGRCVSGQQDHGRRFRELHHHPERVVHLDVQNLMLSDSHPADVVGRVMSRAASRRLSARTMWRWAAVHGTSRLVMVVDAGVAEDTLLDHLDAGTAPDWTALNLFAGLADDTAPAGIPLAELVDVDATPDHEDLALFYDLAARSTVSLDPLELGRFDNLPPIARPGLTPFRPIADWDGDDDWPEVA
ncbi:hypothetical protein [Nocardioides pyridinolyticus]